MADKCPLRSRHKWTWLKNVEIWRIGPRTGSMKLRGLWACECGAKRHGTPLHGKTEPTEPPGGGV